MSASDRAPVERLVAVDSSDVDRLADGDQVEVTMHEAGTERGELDRTPVTVKCVGGAPARTDTPMYGIGAAMGVVATGIAMAVAPGEISAAGTVAAGVIVLAVVVGMHVALGRLERDEEVSEE